MQRTGQRKNTSITCTRFASRSSGNCVGGHDRSEDRRLPDTLQSDKHQRKLASPMCSKRRMNGFAIVIISHGITESASGISPLSAPAADHVLLSLSRVLLSESLCIRIMHGSTEPKFLQDFFKRNPLLPAIQISKHPIYDGIA